MNAGSIHEMRPYADDIYSLGPTPGDNWIKEPLVQWPSEKFIHLNVGVVVCIRWMLCIYTYTLDTGIYRLCFVCVRKHANAVASS